MYGKHFASMYTGSMMGAGPVVFAVWGYAISHAVKATVELNPKHLAAALGTTPEAVASAISYLCSPDPDSRNKAEEGRRLIKEGQFQYHVVSHKIYNAIRDQDARREYNRLKMQEARAQAKNPPSSFSSSLSDIDEDRSLTVNDCVNCVPRVPPCADIDVALTDDDDSFPSPADLPRKENENSSSASAPCATVCRRVPLCTPVNDIEERDAAARARQAATKAKEEAVLLAAEAKEEADRAAKIAAEAEAKATLGTRNAAKKAKAAQHTETVQPARNTQGLIVATEENPDPVQDQPWNILDFAFERTTDFAGLTPKQLQRAVFYHLKVSTNPFWHRADLLDSVRNLERHAQSMLAKVPVDFSVSGGVTLVLPFGQGDPDCKLCDGQGHTIGRNEAYVGIDFMNQFNPCACAKIDTKPWRKWTPDADESKRAAIADELDD
jgi:hypothetical protein